RMSSWWCTRRATRAEGSLEGERARVVGAERDDQRATGEPRRRAFTQDRRWEQALEVQLRAEADARDRGLARPPEHDDDRARALSDARERVHVRGAGGQRHVAPGPQRGLCRAKPRELLPLREALRPELERSVALEE